MKRQRTEIVEENDEYMLIKVFKKIKVEEVIEIYTDGACSGNGTGGAKGGAGVYFVSGEYPNISEKLPGGIQTNNRAEIYAVILALEYLLSEELTGIPVKLHSDSLYVINTITKGWKKKANQDLWGQLYPLITEFTEIYFIHVKGHSGNVGNDIADALARDGI